MYGALITKILIIYIYHNTFILICCTKQQEDWILITFHNKFWFTVYQIELEITVNGTGMVPVVKQFLLASTENTLIHLLTGKQFNTKSGEKE